MKRNVKLNNQGFTIVETLIVLAIAAVIIIIVLLAVPALQRSSRNTTIKNDATTVAGAITNYESENNGTIPTTITGSASAGTYYVCVLSGTATACTATGSEIASVSASTKVAVITSFATPTVGQIYVMFDTECLSTGTAVAAVGAADNNAAEILYPIESSSGTTVAWCLQA